MISDCSFILHFVQTFQRYIRKKKQTKIKNCKNLKKNVFMSDYFLSYHLILKHIAVEVEILPLYREATGIGRNWGGGGVGLVTSSFSLHHIY